MKTYETTKNSHQYQLGEYIENVNEIQDSFTNHWLKLNKQNIKYFEKNRKRKIVMEERMPEKKNELLRRFEIRYQMEQAFMQNLLKEKILKGIPKDVFNDYILLKEINTKVKKSYLLKLVEQLIQEQYKEVPKAEIIALAKKGKYNLGSSKWEWDSTINDVYKWAKKHSRTKEQIEARLKEIDDSFTNEF